MADSASIPVPQDKPWFAKQDWLQRHAQHLAMREQAAFDVVLLGDSITQGWGDTGKDIFERDFAGLRVANFGIGGDATQHLLWRIEQGVLDGLAPKLITLLIGTNNLGNEGHNGEQTAAGVAAVLEAVRQRCPQATVLLHAVFPRAAKPDSEHRRQLAILNDRIYDLSDGSRVIWFDIGHRFLDEDGCIPSVLMPDELHLSPLGYCIWSEELLPLMQDIIGLPT